MLVLQQMRDGSMAVRFRANTRPLPVARSEKELLMGRACPQLLLRWIVELDIHLDSHGLCEVWVQEGC